MINLHKYYLLNKLINTCCSDNHYSAPSSFQLSSESLVRACIDRITEIQPLLNAVVDQRFTDALEEAKKVDRILSSLCSGWILFQFFDCA